jgi:hypothetical protein
MERYTAVRELNKGIAVPIRLAASMEVSVARVPKWKKNSISLVNGTKRPSTAGDRLLAFKST